MPGTESRVSHSQGVQQEGASRAQLAEAARESREKWVGVGQIKRRRELGGLCTQGDRMGMAEDGQGGSH